MLEPQNADLEIAVIERGDRIGTFVIEINIGHAGLRGDNTIGPVARGSPETIARAVGPNVVDGTSNRRCGDQDRRQHTDKNSAGKTAMTGSGSDRAGDQRQAIGSATARGINDHSSHLHVCDQGEGLEDKQSFNLTKMKLRGQSKSGKNAVID